MRWLVGLPSIALASALASLAAVKDATAETQKIPCVSLCEIPRHGQVGGWDAGIPDPAGTWTFLLRDAANNPLWGTSVVLDFSDCGDIRLCDPGIEGQWVSCESRIVTTLTNSQGLARFVIVGAGRNTGAMSGPGGGCVRAHGDGVFLGTLTPAIADQNGALTVPGVEITDLSALLRDFGTGIYFGRSDLDHDDRVTIADLSAWLRVFGRGTSSEGCAAGACP
jgi:hypothetical protein